MNWGIISTARINRQFLAGAREATSVRIAAVASRDRPRGEEFAREHGIEQVHESYESLLADSSVEVVYIPLPNALHIEWTMRALRAGKHVLCEKPLSRRAADVAAAFELAEQQERLLMEGFMFRHHPQTHRVSELLREGAIGRVRMISSAFSFATSNRADVRLSSALDGGALMDVGCYCVNAARMIGGEPERVSAEQTIGGDGVDITFAATMRLRDEVLAHFDAGLALDPRDSLELVGAEGSLYLDDPWHCRKPIIELRRGGEIERIAVEQVDPYRLQAENMSAAVRGDLQPLLGREDAIGQARTVEALYAAADRGSTVTLAGA